MINLNPIAPSHAIIVRNVNTISGDKEYILIKFAISNSEDNRINSNVSRIDKVCFWFKISIINPLVIIIKIMVIYRYINSKKLKFSCA